ncbi:uncharacterized protein BJX67DRAFT_372467 [Aspergillus lucknowensis]|uniref:Zn(2)-C6 fungal-type domain-containing protein n=1 Tax=Aspergillus lucknowensis TaxID=176173 RepID=A0ABR4LSY4_9EURO
MVQTPSNSAHPQESPAKRRRVALACQTCRERKIRCDGARPRCGTCQKRGITHQLCKYLVIAGTAKYQSERAYIDSLHAHIKDLGGIPEQFDSPRQAEDTSPGRDLGVQHISPASNTLPMSLGAMGTAPQSTPDEVRHDEYYGRSSIVSLIHQCAQSSPGRQSPPSGRQPAVPSSLRSASSQFCAGASPSTTMATMLSDEFSLPLRRQADWLLDIYFANNHIFYPWVHKESFMATYESMWGNQANAAEKSLPDVGLGGLNCPVPVFHCALNAMFAIACQFSNMEPHDKQNTSVLYYERIKSLMNIDILESGSLAHVQALLLVAIYLQCTPHSRRCWNVIGMAHRMAVGLGLQNHRQFNGLSVLEKELRWRAWCACVQMDILISMTMGRPPMTQNCLRVPLPSPDDDKHLSASRQGTGQPEGTTSTNQFLHQNMKLIGILWKILLTVYHGEQEIPEEVESSPVPENDFKAIMAIDKALEGFEASLPSVFSWTPRAPPNSDRTFRRQSNVLHARYLHLKLLLYRPTFSTYCAAAISKSDQAQSGSWSNLYQQNVAVRCVTAACDLIHSLSKATTEDATGAWWYGVFYLISAGIVLVLAESSGADLSGITLDQQESSWKECLQTLGRMVDVHPSARDYYVALHDLRQSYTTRQAEGPDQSQASQAPSDTPETNEVNQSVWYTEDAEYNALGPFFKNWDAGFGDIMLPAHVLQDLDEGLLLPSLF